MNFQSMKYFIVLAQERNFSKASSRLFITQQSLSSHIASLETELGCQLLIRHNPLELTYAGEVFLRYAHRYTLLQDTMQKEFSDISTNQVGTLRIGVSYSRSMIFMPSLIDEFQMIHPYLKILLYEDLDLERKLLDRYLDLVLSAPLNNRTNIEFAPIFTDHFFLLIKRSLLNKYHISEETVTNAIKEGHIKPLRNFPFILNETGGSTSKVAHHIFKISDFEPICRCEATNTKTIFSLCLRGIGACFSSKSLTWSLLSDQEQNQLAIFSLPDQYALDIGFLYNKNAYQWSVIQELIQLAKKHHPTLNKTCFPYIFQ